MSDFRTAKTPSAQPPPATVSSQPKDPKSLLAVLRMTTAVGAIGLTLAGWGLLARAASVAEAADVQASVQSFSGSAAALLADNAVPSATPLPAPTAVPTVAAPLGASTGGKSAHKVAALLPTSTPSPAATAVPATAAVPASEAATATPARVVTLDVIQWVRTRSGDPVAVVQDKAGVLWYVWGPDVDRIEQGLEPEYPPQAVNAVARSRAS